MGKRLMAVDDSRMTLMQLEKVLNDTDYEIVAYCKDGEEAIAKYEEVLPDIVTMDIIMPGLDGLETTREIMKKHPEAKIVMLSSLAYDDTITEANLIGAKAFIYKPFEREQVLAALDKVMGEA